MLLSLIPQLRAKLHKGECYSGALLRTLLPASLFQNKGIYNVHNIPNDYPEGCLASVFHQCLATTGSKRVCKSQLHPYHIPIIFRGRSSHCAAPTGAIALPPLCLT